MNGKCLIIAADGTETEMDFDHVPTLEEMKAAIGGGYIEFVPYFETFRGVECVAIGDEEAKIKRMPLNRKATEHWHNQVRIGDYLSGPIAIYYGDDEFFLAVSS